MTQYTYVILNNAGHSWVMLAAEDMGTPKDQSIPVLPQLLADGWTPVRETPMGGGTSSLAHSLILLERTEAAEAKTARPRKPK